MKLLLSILVILLSNLSFSQSIIINKLNYQNIILITDLSSRTSSKVFPLKDDQEINNIIKYFRDECVKPGKKLGDMSSISFHTFTETAPYIIDLSKYSNIGDRQKFINSTGDFKNKGLQFQLDKFKNHITSTYKNVSNKGLDLISVLVEKIQNKIDIKSSSTIKKEGQSISLNYENHLYIFTDGYLEYVNQQNLQFYFGDREIKKIRKYCKDNNIDVSTALKKNSALGLPPLVSSKFSKINLHLLETHERDKNVQYLTYNNPIGLRDNDILEAVWRKWAMQSGFKSFEWKKY